LVAFWKSKHCSRSARSISGTYLMAGGGMGTLLDVLKKIGESAAETPSAALRVAFRKVAVNVGLT
jgi:hypothetical protein